MDEMHLAEHLASEIEMMRLPLEVDAFGPGMDVEDAEDAEEDLDLPWSREPEGDHGFGKG